MANIVEMSSELSMTLYNTTTHYGSISKIFHWLIFLLVVGMLLVGFFMEDITDPNLRSTVINLHKLNGLLILVLMILRICWALVNPKPRLEDMPAWQRVLAHSVHILLYVFLIAMPIAGWLMTVYGGKPPHLFHWALNLPLQENKLLKEFFKWLHYQLALIIIIFVSLHTFAALYHYFIKKDGIMQRML